MRLRLRLKGVLTLTLALALTSAFALAQGVYEFVEFENEIVIFGKILIGKIFIKIADSFAVK